MRGSAPIRWQAANNLPLYLAWFRFFGHTGCAKKAAPALARRRRSTGNKRRFLTEPSKMSMPNLLAVLFLEGPFKSVNPRANTPACAHRHYSKSSKGCNERREKDNEIVHNSSVGLVEQLGCFSKSSPPMHRDGGCDAPEEQHRGCAYHDHCDGLSHCDGGGPN